MERREKDNVVMKAVEGAGLGVTSDAQYGVEYEAESKTQMLRSPLPTNRHPMPSFEGLGATTDAVHGPKS